MARSCTIGRPLALCLCSFILCCCQQVSLASFLPAPNIVADIKYEVIKLMNNQNLQSILFYGCNNVPERFPELAKERYNMTIMCPDHDCQASNYETKRSSNAVGAQMVLTCAQSQAAVEKHDIFFLDAHACIAGFCPATTVLSFHQLAKASGFKYFVVQDFTIARLTATNLLTGETHAFGEGGSQARKVFTGIYDHFSWGNLGGGSGLGSELSYTAQMRPKLVALLKKYNIRSMVDAPCGSLAWMPLILEEMGPDFRYTGLDVACSMLKNHLTTYKDKPNWRFFCLDVCHQELLKGHDLIFSRDAMQHLPFSYISGYLQNVKDTGAKYLLIGTYVKSPGPNVNINVGEYFEINLLLPPFSVKPQPLEIIDEETPDGKHLLLFDVSQLQFDKLS